MARPDLSPEALAAVGLIARCGSKALQIRYSDDEQPVVWFAVATFAKNRWETAAGDSPTTAIIRLTEQLIDGGQCTHCRRGTGLWLDLEPPLITSVCWYVYDPELKTYRRSCEGDT